MMNHKKCMQPRKGLLAVISTMTILTVATHAATILWTFTGGDGSYDSSTSQVPVNFTPGAFDIGNANGTVASLFNTTSSSTTYAGRSGTYNIGNAVLPGTMDPAVTSYFTVTLTPNAGYAIRVTDFDFGTRSTANGPTAFSVRTSVDNYQTEMLIGVGSITPATTSTWTYMNNLISASTAPDSNPVTLRLYVYGGIGNSANTVNSRVDDISISISAVPIPEPSALLLCAAMLGITSAGSRHRPGV